MTIDRNYKYLTSLAIAGLISEGDFDIFSKNPCLKIPFNPRKIEYLQDIVMDGNIEQFITMNIKRSQISIHSFPYLSTLKEQWYKENKKIFSNFLDPSLINMESIFICLNLFGVRKLETISIPTSVEKNHINTLSLCIEHHLKVPIIPTSNQVKITNIKSLIQNCIKDVPALHSAEFINYLTLKEKKELIKGV